MLNRWIEPELLDTLGAEGIGCICFSPLAQGLLTDRYLDGDPGRVAREPRRHALAREADRRAVGHAPGAQRDRRPPRAEPRPARAGVDAARPAHDLDARRGEQRGAARGERCGARQPRVHG